MLKLSRSADVQKNGVLAILPDAVLQRLCPLLKPVVPRKGAMLCAPTGRAGLYFPLSLPKVSLLSPHCIVDALKMDMAGRGGLLPLLGRLTLPATCTAARPGNRVRWLMHEQGLKPAWKRKFVHTN